MNHARNRTFAWRPSGSTSGTNRDQGSGIPRGGTRHAGRRHGIRRRGDASQIGEFTIPEANQGVGVDARHFYAVDNFAIGKYDKKTGKLVKKWQGDKTGPILHLDSAMLMDGKLYAAHSNYPQWPMTSSLEIFDAETLEHVGTHSFGIQWGSLTWADWHDGHWWMTFANYDRPFGPNKTPYGHKVNTVMVKLTKDFGRCNRGRCRKRSSIASRT